MEKTVIGVFKSRGQLEKAVRELKDAGFDDRAISVLAREEGGEGGGMRTEGVMGIG